MRNAIWPMTGAIAHGAVEGVDRAFVAEDYSRFEVIHFSEAEAALLANTVEELFNLPTFATGSVVLRSDLRVVFERLPEEEDSPQRWSVRFIFDGHDIPDLVWIDTRGEILSEMRIAAAKAKTVSADRRAEFIKELKLALKEDAGGKKPDAS